jgi:hypothetical protein
MVLAKQAGEILVIGAVKFGIMFSVVLPGGRAGCLGLSVSVRIGEGLRDSVWYCTTLEFPFFEVCFGLG